MDRCGSRGTEQEGRQGKGQGQGSRQGKASATSGTRCPEEYSGKSVYAIQQWNLQAHHRPGPHLPDHEDTTSSVLQSAVALTHGQNAPRSARKRKQLLATDLRTKLADGTRVPMVGAHRRTRRRRRNGEAIRHMHGVADSSKASPPQRI